MEASSQMSVDRAPVLVGRSFGVLWVLASIVGWALGSVVSDTLGDVVGQVWFDSVGLIVLGASIGGMQWLVLRRQVSWAGWWVVANIAGWTVGALVNLPLNLPLGLFPGWLVGLLVAGVFQWLVLRRHIYRATWWLLVSFAGFVTGSGISVAIPGCLGPCSAAVLGAVLGAMTGIALAWLLRQPVPPSGEAEAA